MSRVVCCCVRLWFVCLFVVGLFVCYWLFWISWYVGWVLVVLFVYMLVSVFEFGVCCLVWLLVVCVLIDRLLALVGCLWLIMCGCLFGCYVNSVAYFVCVSLFGFVVSLNNWLTCKLSLGVLTCLIVLLRFVWLLDDLFLFVGVLYGQRRSWLFVLLALFTSVLMLVWVLFGCWIGWVCWFWIVLVMLLIG